LTVATARLRAFSTVVAPPFAWMMKSFALGRIASMRGLRRSIGVHHRRQVAVHHRCAGALVFAIFGVDDVRLADGNPGQIARDDRGGTPFMLGIEEREEKADRHCFDPVTGENIAGLLDR
jgi:hypothetical protein